MTRRQYFLSEKACPANRSITGSLKFATSFGIYGHDADTISVSVVKATTNLLLLLVTPSGFEPLTLRLGI